MAATIDERVVEMRFDNKQFEEGVKKSMKSLNKLDETINKMDESTNLDEMTKKINKINFDGMEDNLKKLGKRFSTFGIAGMTVVQDLTHAAEKLFGTFTKFLSKPLAIAKSGGWARALNIEEAKFQLKGLGVAWEEVSDDIDYAVSGTAFGLDAAAKAASQLTASGVELGDSMKQALRGISGVAAMTNSAYEEISPIFTTIAGQGKLMTMQLRQLEARGLNAAAQLAKAIGVTEAELRDMVTKGVIDFNTFAKAMDDAFGEHAKDANSTFSGALGNMQFALKKIGADIAEEIQTDFIDVFNDVRLVINSLHKELEPSIQILNKWIRVGSLVLRKMLKWVRDSGALSKAVSSATNAFRDLTNVSVTLFVRLNSLLGPTLKSLSELGDSIAYLGKEIFGLSRDASPLKLLLTVLLSLIDGLAKGITVISTMLSSMIRYIADNEYVKKFIRTISPLADYILPTIITLLVLSKLHMLKTLVIVSAIVGVIGAIIAFDIPGKIMLIIENVKGLAATIWTNLQPALNSVKGAIESILTALAGIGTIFENFIANIFNIGSAVSATGEAIDNAKDSMFGLGSAFTDFVESIKKAFSDKLDYIKTWFINFAGSLNLVELSVLGISAGFAIAAITIANAIKNIAKLVKQFNPFGWLVELALSFKKMVEYYGKVQLIYSIAAALLSLAGAIAVFTAAVAGLAYVLKNDEFRGWGFAAFGMLTALAVAAAVWLTVFIKLKMTMAETYIHLHELGLMIEPLAKAAKKLAAAFKFLAFGAMMISFAIAISIMAEAIAKLAKVKGDVVGVTIALGSIVLVIGILAIAIEKLEEDGLLVNSKGIATILAVGVAIAAFAAAFKLLTDSLKKLSKLKIDWGNLLINLIPTLVSLVLVIAGAIVILVKLAPMLEKITISITNVGVGIAAFVAALWILPYALQNSGEAIDMMSKSIKKMGDKFRGIMDEIRMNWITLGGILVGIIAVSQLASHVIETISIIGGLILNLRAFVELLADIGSDQAKLYHIDKGMRALEQPIVMFTVIVGLILGLSKLAGNGLRAAAMFLSIAGTIVVVLETMRAAYKWGVDTFSNATLETMMQGLVGIITLVSIIGMIVSMTKDQQFKASAPAMLALSLTIVSLGVVMSLLTILAKDNPLGVIVAGTGIAIALYGMSKVFESFGQKINFRYITRAGITIGVMSAVLAGLVAALTIVAKNNGFTAADIALEVGALGGLLIVIAKVFDMLNSNFSKYSKKKIKRIILGITGLAVAMIPMAIAIAAVSYYDWDSILPAAASLAVIIGELSLLIIPLSKLEPKWKNMLLTLGGITALIVALFPIGEAIKKLAGYTWNDLGAAVNALSIMAIALTVLGGVIAIVSKAISENGGAKALITLVTTLAVGGALIALAVGISLLSTAIGKLAIAINGVDISGLISILNIINILVISFEVVVVALGLIGSKEPMVAVVLAALALVLGVLAVAATSCAQAVSTMATSIMTFLNELIPKLPQLSSGVKELGTTFIYLINKFFKTFPSLAKNLGKALGILAKEFAITVHNMLKIAGEAAIDAATLYGKFWETIIIYHGIFAIELLAMVSAFFAGLGQVIYNGITGAVYAGRMAFEDSKYLLTAPLEEIGEWVPRSLSDGMMKPFIDLINTAKSIAANGIEKPIRDTLDVHSESPKFVAIGQWVTTSLANGLQSVMDTLFSAAENVGKTTTEGISEGAQDKGIVNGIIDFFGNMFSGITSTASAEGSNAGGAFAGGLFGTLKEKLAQLPNILSGIGNLFGSTSTVTVEVKSMAEYRNEVWKDVREGADTANIKRRSQEIMKEQQKLKEEERTYHNILEVQSALVEKEASRRAGNASDRASYTQLDGILKGLQDEFKKTAKEAEDLANSVDDGTGATDGYSNSIAGNTGAVKENVEAQKSLGEQLVETLSAFDEFSIVLNRNSDEIIANMQNNTNSLYNMLDALAILRDRGFNADMLKEIASKGVTEAIPYLSALLEMDKKGMKQLNKSYKEHGIALETFASVLDSTFDKTVKLTKKERKAIIKSLGLSSKEAKKLTDAQLASMDAWATKLDMVGEKVVTVEDAYNSLFTTLTKKLTAADWGKASSYFSEAIDNAVFKSNKKAKDAKQDWKNYMAAMFLETLSEEELLEELAKKPKEILNDAATWWKESTKEMESSIQDQIRALGDLRDAYDMTGDELVSKWAKQNTDFQEITADRYYIASLLDTMKKPQSLFSDYIRNAASESEVLSIIDGLTKAMASGGQEAAEEWLLNASKTWKSGGLHKDITQLIQDYEYALAQKDEELIKAAGERLKEYVTHIKSYAEVYNDVVDGIEAGIKKLLSSNKDISRMSKTITRVYSGMSSALGVEAFRTGEEAIRKYAMSLIDWEEVLEESKVFGVDSESIIETRISDITDSLPSFRNSVESNLKGALQAFDKFDVGEKISFETLQKNLRSNMTTMNEWRANIRKLQAKGYSEEVIRAMEEEGVSSYQKVAALVDSEVTDAQVDSINQMWQQTGLAARDAADEATGAMIMAASTAGQDLTDSMNVVIEESAEEAKTTAYDLYTGVGESAIDGLDASNLPENVEEIMNETVDTIVNTVTDPANLKEITNAGIKAGEKLTHGIRKGIQDTIPETKEKAKRLAAHAIDGVRKGLEEGKGPLYEKVRLIARRCLEEAEDELDINSPSKKTEWIAQMAMKGFEVGIDDEANNVTNDMISWMDDFMRYADEAANEIQAYWDNVGADTEIKPVLNLDNLQNARSLIGDMLKGDQTIALTSGKLAAEASVNDNAMTRLMASLNHTGNTTNTNNYGDTTIVVNAPEGADTNEIAEMVMVKIQQRIDRRKYV